MALVLTLLSLLAAGNAQTREPASVTTGAQPATWLEIDPGQIEVGTFYSGTTVRVEGVIPVGYEAAVACVGKADTIELKKKGRIFGILWMNVGDVEFPDVPSFYVLNTSTNLSELAPSPVLNGLQVGYPAIEARTTRPGGDDEKHQLFQELLKLKESERLYSLNEEGVRLGPEEEGAVHLSAQCFMPAKAPSGNYDVRLFVFQGGRGELLHTKRLGVAQVGATAFISILAQRHGLLYGVLAVVIALVVGLLTGFVFGLSSKTGH